MRRHQRKDPRQARRPEPVEYQPTLEQRRKAYSELMASPYFTTWSSQEPLFKDWGNWKGERKKQ
jgi:hypothetical protein